MAEFRPRRRGNQDWGRVPMVPPPDAPTEFDICTKQLGLRQEDYVASALLRSWCERHRNQCYIPEWLLEEWGIEVDPNYSN
jgi:hypothetical protein